MLKPETGRRKFPGVCVGVSVGICEPGHIYRVHLCGEHRCERQPRVDYQSFFPFIFKDRVSHWPGIHQVGWGNLPESLKNFLFSPHQHQDSQWAAHAQLFLMWVSRNKLGQILHHLCCHCSLVLCFWRSHVVGSGHQDNLHICTSNVPFAVSHRLNSILTTAWIT